MRKTLLIAGAALAASIISSQAQTVYSQNVVGYVNTTIPGGHYQIIGSQLINGSDVAQTNGDVNFTINNGLISSPNDPGTPSQVAAGIVTNTQMIVWSQTLQGFATYYWFNAADATTWETVASPAGWYDKGGAPLSLNLANSGAVFIYNAHPTVPITVTQVGTVAQGTNVVSINANYSLICLQEPCYTNPVVDASGNAFSFGLPASQLKSYVTDSSYDPGLAANYGKNDQYTYWGGTGFATYYWFSAADATTWYGSATPAGFYDRGGTPLPTTSYPLVNQGFFLNHFGGTILWTNSFTVQ